MSAGRRTWVGTRIGRIEVLAPTDERKNGYMVWRCRCDCGTEAVIGPSRSNTSGYVGVCRDRQSGKWAAYIRFRNRKYNLGRYEDIEDAVKARLRGEEMYDAFLDWYYSGRASESGASDRKAQA